MLKKVAICYGVAFVIGQCVHAQEGTYRGTWKLDAEHLATELRTAGFDEPTVERQLGRMRSMRFILNENGMTTVRDEFPQEMAWEVLSATDGQFRFTINGGPEGLIANITMDGSLRMTLTYSQEGAPELILVKISDETEWRQPKELTIGTVAPEISVASWLTGPPFDVKFGNGRVYVIEFWATWCGPCLEKMPALFKLQELYSDSVGIIAITMEDDSTVRAFNARKRENGGSSGGQVRGLDLEELSKSIAIGIDLDGNSIRSFMTASGLQAVPCAFVVGKAGLIEWAGCGDQLSQLSEVLPGILDGTWDRERFARKFKGYQRAYREIRLLQRLVAEGKRDEAIRLADELSELADDSAKLMIRQIKIAISKGTNTNKE